MGVMPSQAEGIVGNRRFPQEFGSAGWESGFLRWHDALIPGIAVEGGADCRDCTAEMPPCHGIT